MSIVVMASGSGTNFEALAKAFPGFIDLLICNVPEAGCLEVAKRHHIRSVVIPHKNYEDRRVHEYEVAKAIGKIHSPLLLVLAGYNRVLTSEFFLWGLPVYVESYLVNVLKIFNLHPALLDEYKGPKGYEAAAKSGKSHWGLTVHHVTPEVDTGEVVRIATFPLQAGDTAEGLHAFARPYEHQLLIEAVSKHLNIPPAWSPFPIPCEMNPIART